jgi:hypothetical protein
MFKWKKCEIHAIKYDCRFSECPLCGLVRCYRASQDEYREKLEAAKTREEELFDNNRQLDKHIGIYEDAMCELEEFCDRMFVDKERCEDCLGGCTECDNFKGR